MARRDPPPGGRTGRIPLYPGHGGAGGTGLLGRRRQYLLMYREAVARLAGGAPGLNEEQRTRLTRAMTRFLPGASLDWLVGLGADAVATELEAEQDAA